MLDPETRQRIDTARNILVGKIPNPQAQVEQITIALIYKFMFDMDAESVELSGKPSFFTEKFAKFSWNNLLSKSLGGADLINLYSDAIQSMTQNQKIPALFRDIFKNAFLPYRDPETLRSFLKIINEFKYDHSERLGDAFEYLLSILGSQGDAGQFRTPRHIIDFMVEIIDPKKNESILDPACGTAGFLISAYKHIIKHNSTAFNPVADEEAYTQKVTSAFEVTSTSIAKYKGDKLTPAEKKRLTESIKGYDISPDMVRLSLVNLYLHGFLDPKISEYDTLTSVDKWNEYFDIILANPPFMSPSGGIRPHKRFSIPANRSEVLFVDYIAEHLTTNGRAAIIVPEGIIFQSGNAYKSLRKMLVENSLLAVISLPAGVFNPYSGVKTSILILDKSLAKKTENILFVKIENDGFDLGAQRRVNNNSELPAIVHNLKSYISSISNGTVFGISVASNFLLASKVQIAENGDYNLSGERYITLHKRTTEFAIVPLGEICKVINGKAFKQEELLDKGKYQVLRVGNFFSNRGWYYSDLELDEDKYCDTGDLLYAWSASFGPRIWSGGKTIYHYHIWKLIPDESRINKLFLHHLLASETENIKSQGGRGIAMIHITKEGMEKTKIPLPPLEVQKEIVAEIESYQKIIVGARLIIENYKPQITVDSTWPIVELVDLIKLSSGRGLTSSNMVEGKYPVYGGNGINGYHNAYFLEQPTVVIGRVGAYCGAVHLTEPKSWITDNGLYVTELLSEINIKYLHQMLTQLNLNQYAKVGGQPSISQKTVTELSIPVPDLDIQNNLVLEIEDQKALVANNTKLIAIFEQKIKDRIASVWNS